MSQSCVVPPPLQAGDSIYLLSTARALSPEQADAFVGGIRAAGHTPIEGASLRARHHIFAGADAQRAADLQAALAHPQARAIWCGRGGYGTTRMLDLVDLRPLAAAPKWIIGFSDVTALLAASTRQGVACIHGPLGIFAQAADDGGAWQETLGILRGQWPTYSWQAHPRNVLGQASGRLMGGNLSLLAHVAGSPTAPDLADSLLFLEDVDEYLYQIDRMLLQLHRAGQLAQVRGVVAGTFRDMHDNPESFGSTLEEILTDAFAPYGIPVALHFPAGHIPHNRPLILGVRAALSVTPEGCQLRYQP